MSAQAFVLQMVRAHYRRDDAAFAYAASSIGRQAKSPSIRTEIETLVRRGFPRPPQGGGSPAQPSPRSPESTPVVSNGLLQKVSDGLTFPDLLLPPDLQAQLDEIVEELEYGPELRRRGLAPRSRLLFHGPPGNGKTSVASALANALGATAYTIYIPELISQYIGGTGGNLGKVFGEIRNGMVVVFDEIDAIGGERGGRADGAGAERNAIVNTLLTLFDLNKNGIIVATTNRVDIIDPALRRRFDEKLLFPAPTQEQKEALATKLCLQFEIEQVDVSDCENFDAVTKRVRTEARRIVMAEIRARESAEEDETEDDLGNEGDDE